MCDQERKSGCSIGGLVSGMFGERDCFMVKTWTKRSKYHEYHLYVLKLLILCWPSLLDQFQFVFESETDLVVYENEMPNKYSTTS